MKIALVALSTLAALAACAAPTERVAAPSPPPAAAPKCAPVPASLIARDLQEGRGDPVTPRTAVMVHYTGWLYDGCAPDLKGKQFDTSSTRGVPLGVVVGAGRVIKGWDEGLLGMREGGKRLLVIPPDKAYGTTGAGGGLIPPDATLVFETELVKIIERPQAQPR